MEITSLYWRQLYLYLSRQQRRRRQALKRSARRAAAADITFRPARPLPHRDSESEPPA
jgi:hypothetical protein